MKVGIMILMSIFLLVSCSGEKETNVQKLNSTTGIQQNTVKSELKEFSMDSFTEIIDGEYHPQFTLKEIKVKKGDRVKININTTKGVHDFKIDEFGVHSETPEGEVTTVEFIADKAGEFIYWCTKPGHKKNGHWGTLIVEE